MKLVFLSYCVTAVYFVCFSYLDKASNSYRESNNQSDLMDWVFRIAPIMLTTIGLVLIFTIIAAIIKI